MKAFVILLIGLIALGGCTDADVASQNLRKAAEYFELERRIVFYNGITGEYILSIEGKCSIEKRTETLAVTCKTGATEFKKHHLGVSDNVTFFSEQLEAVPVDAYHYRVVFKPAAIIPDIEVR